MRAKLRGIKQQLRQRMHDLVEQTGKWLKSVVQGYFNYDAVPEPEQPRDLSRTGDPVLATDHDPAQPDASHHLGPNVCPGRTLASQAA
jgi:hypothetical protein